MAATTALREALNEGISSGNLVDTKIILYSHRDSSGRICRPKALYANSHILKTVPYFDKRECAAAFDLIHVETSQYDFEVLFGSFAESHLRDFEEEINKEESTEDYGYLSDSDLEEDEDESASSFEHTPKSKVHLSDTHPAPGEDNILCELHKECVGKGKVVKIPDMAFVT
jgi:hypothetical protein